METRVSSKGQVVLPSPIRRRLGIAAGDPLDVAVERGRVILTLKRKRGKAKLVTSSRTGLPVLKANRAGSQVTSEIVERLLDEFP